MPPADGQLHETILISMTRRSFIHTGAALTAAAQGSKASPNGKIAVGIIGAGARAHELMQAIMKRPEEAEIAGVVDAYKGRVERAIERTGGRAKALANYHDLSRRNRSTPWWLRRRTTGIAASSWTRSQRARTSTRKSR